MRRKLPVHVSLFVLGLVLIAAALVVAMIFDPQPATAQEPGADGAALMSYILEENPYMAWGSFPADRWSDFGGYLQSGAPHGNTVRIFVNDVALDAIAAEGFDGVLPPGSIVVKENFGGTVDEPGDLAALTVMSKVDGFNPDANDWFWVKAQADGTVDAEGAVEGCINCHAQDGNADYLLRYAFGAQPATTYGEPLPEGDGAAIVTYLTETSPYTEWGSWPANEMDDFSGFLGGTEPHGATIRIYVNDRALNAIERENFPGVLPNGSFVVKENYGGTPGAPGDLAAVTLMYKVEGFNPDANDWYWVAFAPDGTVNAEGAVEGCINCHSQDGNSDYLLRYQLPEGMMHEDMMGMDGEALVQERCTVCHTADRITNAMGQKDRAAWEETVDRMIGYGAQLNADEREAVLDYLAGGM
jgi:cytochrome c553